MKTTWLQTEIPSTAVRSSTKVRCTGVGTIPSLTMKLLMVVEKRRNVLRHILRMAPHWMKRHHMSKIHYGCVGDWTYAHPSVALRKVSL